MTTKKRVFVGMSGGVDSSTTAALLKQQGYDVTGVYMKNWAEDLPGFYCPWQDDYEDAMRVAVQLDIPFKMYDFQKEYRSKVVDYMLDAYKQGLTPNPDIMCNQEIKFKLFLDAALEDGADLIATGHYAHTKDGRLYQARDSQKDQSYFLYRVDSAALERTLFPLGDTTKDEVRQTAKKLDLATANKPDSQGICFIGDVPIEEFLAQFIDTEPGNIIDENAALVGQHNGALFYTIGQRHGLGIGGGLPYYVTGKDMAKNEVYVTSDISSDDLWSRELTLVSTHWIVDSPIAAEAYQARIRHRGELLECKVVTDANKTVVVLADSVRAAAAGQSVVIYRGNECLGGGIISKTKP
jgi:tRNA-uridine 2-sulfurtransferase